MRSRQAPVVLILGALVAAPLSAPLSAQVDARVAGQEPPPLFGGKLCEAGTAPLGIVAADFDGDGTLDVATANSRSNDVSVLPGNGRGGLGAQVRYAVGDRPSVLVTADWNGDGRMDLATANGTSHDVSLLLAAKDGGFESARTTAAGVSGSSLTAADVDGDGHPDLLSAIAGERGVAIFLGDGSGGFAAPTMVGTGCDAWDVTAADVNGDGRMDLVVTSDTKSPGAVVLADAAGGFASPQPTPLTSSMKIAVADVNADGKADLLSADGYGKSMSMALGRGDGSFDAAVITDMGTPVIDLAIVRWNGDDRPDLLLLGDSGVLVLLGNGDGSFAPGPSLVNGTGSRFMAAGAFLGAGHTDIAVTVATQNAVALIPGAGDGVPASCNHRVPAPAGGIALGDVNGDGHVDAVTCLYSVNRLAILDGDGHGGFEVQKTLDTGKSPSRVSLSDLNTDGWLDIASVDSASNQVSVFMARDGHGALAAPAHLTGPAPSGAHSRGKSKGFGFPQSIAVGDVDGDRHPDCVIAAMEGSAVIPGDGHGGLGSAVELKGGAMLSCAALADLDADGSLDIVAGGDAVPHLVLWLSSAGGTLREARVLSPTSGASALAVADFNEDGHADIAAVQALVPELRLHLGDGKGGFALPSSVPVPDNTKAMVAADLDRDGHCDLATIGFGIVDVLRGDGTGHFKRERYLAGLMPEGLAIGDVDRDGFLDLVTANASSTISVLRNLTAPR